MLLNYLSSWISFPLQKHSLRDTRNYLGKNNNNKKQHLFSKHYYSYPWLHLPLHMISVSRYLVSFGYRNQDFSGRSPHLTYKLRAKETKVLPGVAYMVGGGRWLPWKRKCLVPVIALGGESAEVVCWTLIFLGFYLSHQVYNCSPSATIWPGCLQSLPQQALWVQRGIRGSARRCRQNSA